MSINDKKAVHNIIRIIQQVFRYMLQKKQQQQQQQQNDF